MTMRLAEGFGLWRFIGRFMICPHTMTFAALVVQATTFWLTVTLLSLASVGCEAWVLLSICCAVISAISSKPRPSPSLFAWLQVLLYALLFAVILFGANFALDALSGSIKTRRPLPPFFHGLEFYLVWCPGIASIAMGGIVRNLLLRSTALAIRSFERQRR